MSRQASHINISRHRQESGHEAQATPPTRSVKNWRAESILHSQKCYLQKRPLYFSLVSLGRLSLLFVIALFLTLFLAAGSVTAEMLLFQSPQSPPAQPPAEQPPAEQPPTPQPPTPQPPTAQPPAEQLPAEPRPAEQPPAEQPATQQPATEQSPAQQPQAEQPTAESLSPLEPVPASEAPLSGQPLPDESADTARDELLFEDQGDEEANLTLDQAELIDSVVVSGAYVWLCCGVILFLFVPLFFLLLYIRGRSKMSQEESF